jgi:DNA polymerase-3 subunit delta'
MKRGKIPHAYLFTGISGVGKTQSALAFAATLNCHEPVDGEGCGRCLSCSRIASGNSPDVFIITRKADKKKISIEQIQELNRKLGFPPMGTYRVSVVREAETMTAEAANCLLKTLEEPPPGNIIILNAVEQRDLLPTIVSRCQRVPFQPLPLEDMARWLVKRENMDEEKAKVLTKVSGGSLGRARKMVETDFLEKRQTWLQMLFKLAGLSREKAFEMALECAEEAKKMGVESKNTDKTGALDMLAVWESWYRDLLLLKVEGTNRLLMNEDFSHLLKNSVDHFTKNQLIDSLVTVDRAARDLRRMRNIRLVMEHTILQLWRLTI